MHYYNFHIGDYMRSTRHLSLLEDIAYRRLLDVCYDTEKPIPLEIADACRLIGMRDNPEETQQILSEYFSKTQKGWIHKRVQKELGVYAGKAERARANGKLGGRPKKTQRVNSGNPDVTQKKANQEPRTNNQEPITKVQKTSPRFTRPSVDEVRNYCLERQNNIDPESFFAHYEANGWVQGKGKPIKNWKMAVITWEKSRNEESRRGNNQNTGRKLSALERVQQAARNQT